ncbi:MAG: dihydrolipoyl dehydrogenase [Bdellovibrionales bacterium]|nr:dihydrolipoyl dehydrogenase [Bdellovibrionales bacterium]
MADTVYDLLVIGAGTGGYEAAIRASQLGMKVALAEKGKTLGGTCLNVGCIPSKALLESSEHYHVAKHKLSKHGVLVSDVKLDLAAMLKRKDAVVRQLTGGVEFLFKKNKIDWLKGLAKITDAQGEVKKVDVAGTTYSAKKVLIATGSEPSSLPFLPYDGKKVVSSTEALEFTEVPKHLVVIGGGVIGLELGSVWLRLGAKVTVVEFLDRLVPGMDSAIATELQKVLTKQGMEFRLFSKCTGATQKGDWTLVEAEDRKTGTKFTLEADRVLIATGRRPVTKGLGAEEAGIKINKAGQIEIDDHFQTSVKGVYAVGDVVRGPMLAHKAGEEGVAVAEILAGQAGHVNYEAIPGVIYTWPEVASVGATEDELKEKGTPIKVGSFPFQVNGRAKAMDETDGFVKIIAHQKTDRVLGVHIIGPRAGDLIAEAAALMEFGASSEDIARTTHAHPTLAEVFKEAALAVDKRQIHL